MSDYTVELRKITHWPEFQRILSEYPIYAESNRERLNALFVNKYMFRDIGYETPEMFLQRLEYKLHEIMPLYNDVFRTVELDFDFTNVDLSTTSESETVGRTEGTSSSDSASDTTGQSATVSDQLDMPQTQLEQDGDYLTSRGTSEGATSSTATSSGNERREDDSTAASDARGTTRGRSGVTQAALMLEYRSAILNVNSLIVDDLSVLFMRVWRPVSRHK